MHLLARLRAACLSRGECGIKSFGCSFRIFDDSGDRYLDIYELEKALHDYGIKHTPNELNELFANFDSNNSGVINFDEFLDALRPPMSDRRKSLVFQAFQKMDHDQDGIITIEDLEFTYNAKKHPKYLNGQWTEEECFKDFLKSFDSQDHPDSRVTRDEFLLYYAGVSNSIDADNYFDLMMRNAWKI